MDKNRANRESGLPARPLGAPAHKLPLSGSEELFTNVTYGSRRGVDNNNCYGWAIGDYRNSGNRKLQPGNLSGARGDLNLGSCSAVVNRAAADLLGRGYRVDADTPCRKGHYKVMAFLAPNNDYHWYKQHRDVMVTWPEGARTIGDLAARLGVRPAQIYAPTASPQPGDRVLVKNANLWSHKQGFATGPLLKDACDKAITDPRKACRQYGSGLDYKQYCGALCVKKRP